MKTFFGQLGASVLQALEGAGYTTLLMLRAMMYAGDIPRRFRQIVHQIYVTGWQSILVTMMFSAVTGMIVALQTGIEIKKFGLEERIGSIVALSMIREMGPLMAAIIVTGRVGSSMAAEIGTMSVSEEIEALEIMAIDPIRFLVMPRVFAMAIVLPMLTVIGSTVGMLGGMFVAWAQVGVGPAIYYRSASAAVLFPDLFWGVGKTVFFGIAIASIACANGLRARGGALGVGQASRNAVVTTLVIVIIINYISSSIFLAFHDAPI